MSGAAESNAGQPIWPLKVTLSNGHSYGADLVVAAIGVEPNVEWVAPEVARANDGGLLVSRQALAGLPQHSCVAYMPDLLHVALE